MDATRPPTPALELSPAQRAAMVRVEAQQAQPASWPDGAVFLYSTTPFGTTRRLIGPDGFQHDTVRLRHSVHAAEPAQKLSSDA